MENLSSRSPAELRIYQFLDCLSVHPINVPEFMADARVCTSQKALKQLPAKPELAKPQSSEKEGKDKALVISEAMVVDYDSSMKPKTIFLKKGKRAYRMHDSSDDSSDDSDDEQNEATL